MAAEASRRPDAVVHIGTSKTGTTALQEALLAARDRLVDSGIAYLASPGMINARELAAASVGDTGFDDHLDTIGADSPDARRRFRVEVGERFADQVRDAHGCSTVVLSSEHLHSRLVEPSMVENFLTLVSPHVGSIRVVCFLRPQVDLVASFHSTHVRNGGANTFAETVAKMLRTDWTYTNYDLLLAPWADALGTEAIDVRIFDRTSLVGGDIVSDFATVLGLADGVLLPATSDANPSIDRVGQVLLEELNRATSAGAIATERASDLRRRVAESFVGPGQALEPERAVIEQQRFDESNERVRARFRPATSALFSSALPPSAVRSIAPATAPQDLGAQESVLAAVFDVVRDAATAAAVLDAAQRLDPGDDIIDASPSVRRPRWLQALRRR